MKLWPLIALAAAAPLAAQAPEDAPPRARSRGYTFGVTGFTRGEYQPGGLEFGMLRAVGSEPGRNVAALIRLGSFVQDQAVLYGRTTGFFTGLILAGRVPLATLAEVGSERSPSFLRLIAVVEGGGQINFASPLPQGSAMGIGSALLGFSFANGPQRVDESFAVLVGPAWFFGTVTDFHLQATLRYQVPTRSR